MPNQHLLALQALNHTGVVDSWANQVALIASRTLIAEYSQLNYGTCGAASEFDYYVTGIQIEVGSIW